MPIQECTLEKGCQPEPANVVMDMNWRWLHNKDGSNNCQLDGKWDPSLCSNDEQCMRNCALEGVNAQGYSQAYKAETVANNGLKLTFPKAPRVYMTESSGDRYKMFKLLNREFAFDVDVSTLPCGMNAALYFVEMPADGDMGGANTVGAKYGAGYCDAQCPHMRVIGDKANLNNWKTHLAKNPDGKWIEVGPEGELGNCCAEMDLFEANTQAAQFTAHPCLKPGRAHCVGDEQCGNKDKNITGWCDKDGCGMNAYRSGVKDFWGNGPNFTVDTSRPLTVITQFITTDGTDTGDLREIRQKYVQDGKVIHFPETANLPNNSDMSLNDDLCQVQADTYKDSDGFRKLGGIQAMGAALGRGMVLTMSIWDDNFGRMLWLDAEKDKIDANPHDLGVSRGPCKFYYGADKDMKDYLQTDGDVQVTFSNVRVGEIGSTGVSKATPERKFDILPSGVATGREPAGPRAWCVVAALGAMATAGLMVLRHWSMAAEDAETRELLVVA